MDLGTHLTGGWVHPKDGMDVCEKRKKPLAPIGIQTPERQAHIKVWS